jgi:ribonuclease HI
MGPPLPKSGVKEIVVYGDASFSKDLFAGAWAAYIPAFGLSVSGIAAGSSIEHFEMLALVEGVGAALAINHTIRPLHLYTDSQCVMIVLQHLSSRSPLPESKKFENLRDLYCHCRVS